MAGAVIGADIIGKVTTCLLRALGEVIFEPIAGLGSTTQVAAGFAVDRFIQADPVPDQVWPLAVPRQVSRRVPVAKGRVRAKTYEPIDAHLSRETPARPVIAYGLVTSDQSRIGWQAFQTNRTQEGLRNYPNVFLKF